MVDAAFDAALDILRSLGATVVDNAKYSEFDKNFTYADDVDWTLGLRVAIRESQSHMASLGEVVDITAADMKKSLATYESNPEALYTLADVIKYTQDRVEEENDRWGVEEWLKCEELGDKYGPHSVEFRQSLEWRHRIGKQISELLDRTHCDFILFRQPWIPVPTWEDVQPLGCRLAFIPRGRR